MKAIVIGSGVISSAHIEAYRKKGIEIASIVDPVREAREKAADMQRHALSVRIPEL